MKNVLDLSVVRGDEYYTLRKDVEVIADNLRERVCGGGYKPLKIWCPFDTDTSNFPIVLRERGYDVINTCTDFFETSPPEGVNCVISNPPFSRKKDVLIRLAELELPFVLILPILFINNGVPFDYGHQLMMFRKRMFFDSPEGLLNKPRTNCVVLSNGLLKHDFTIIR